MKKSLKLCLLTLCFALMAGVLAFAGLNYAPVANAQSITPPDGYTVHNINDGGLTITSSGKYYVYGTGENTENEMVVKGDIDVEMILDGVNVIGSKSRAYGAIRLQNGATLTIRLVGNNKLYGCNSAPGIEVPEGTTVIITSYDGDGSTLGTLNAKTGSATFINGSGPVGKGGAGIGAGGTYGSTTSARTLGNIIIKGGTILSIGQHGGAGIGGAYNSTTGSIRIEGGIVKATTADYDPGLGGGAAIGGGFCGYVPKIEITGGTVTAYAKDYGEKTMAGADIGAGYFSLTSDASHSFGDITISGGNVTCSGASVGGNDAIGFGRIYNANGYTYTLSGSVTVTGGTITANRNISNLVKVTGGTINGSATGEPTYGSRRVYPRTITVSGAFTNQAVEKISLSDSSSYNIKDVVITDTNKLYFYLANNVKINTITVAGTVYTNYTGGDILCYHDARSTYKPVPKEGSTTHHDIVYECCGFYSSTEEHSFDNTHANCTTPEVCACGETRSLYPDIHASNKTYCTLNASDKAMHDVKHSCCNALKETVLHNFSGMVCTECSHICEHPKMENSICIYCGFEGVAYIDRYWDGTKLVEEVKATLEKPIEVTESTDTMTDGWYLMNSTFTKVGSLTVSGTVHLIIGNDANVNIRKGLIVNAGNTLYIYAQSNDPAVMGTLTATAYDQGAGIGGAYETDAGTIIINGGRINADSGNSAGKNGMVVSGAAIGGGYSANAGSVTINGGIISATSSLCRPIGSGTSSPDASCSVTINGGTITLSKASNSYGIGSFGENTVIKITGGTIINNLNESADGFIKGDAIITGGTISAAGTIDGSAVDANGNALVAYPITLDGWTENSKVEAISGVNYGLFEVYTFGDKLCIFLPEKTHPTSITVGGTEYICNDNGTFYTEHGDFIEADCINPLRCSVCNLGNGEPNGHSFEGGICTVCHLDENGFYNISTLDDYISFVNIVQSGNNKVNALLKNDLDISEISKALGNMTVGTVDSKFSGIFDGNGYTLTTYVSGEEYVAPFGYVDGATIKNLVVKGTVVASGKFAGGLVASASGTIVIENVLVETVIESSVNGDGTHGGVIGVTEGVANVTLTGVGFTGEIKGEKTTSCGGFVGWMADNTVITITNSFNFGKFSTKTTSCHTIARNYTGTNITVTVKNFYYLSAYGTTPSSAEITVVTNDQILSGEACYMLNSEVTDGTQPWYQTVNTDVISITGETVYYVSCADVNYYSNNAESFDAHEYENGICVHCSTYTAPQTDDNGVYVINNAGELYWFAGLVNGTLDGVEQNKNANAMLASDIDLGGGVWKPIASTGLFYASKYTSGTNYPDKGYTGTFDGNYHVIKNFTVKGNSGIEESYGLFGTLSGTVKNLGIDGMVFDLNSASDIRVGAIVGQILGGTVENCFVINSTISPENFVAGGIAGSNYAGTIKNCFVYNTTLNANRSGGIVGDNRADGGESDRMGTVENCFTNSSSISGSYEGVITNSTVGDEGFGNGEVAFNLGAAFGQKLGVDLFPCFAGETVYKVLSCDGESYTYSNVDAQEEHFDAENDGDHACDKCNESSITACADANGDGNHTCDECEAKINDCADASGDGNHTCDECEAKINDCADANGDGNHTCDECEAKINDCVDADENYVCDECGAELERDGLSGGAIAGIAGGSTIGLGGLGYLVFFLIKRRGR
ncbi:MAG: hypothetical protein IKC36_02680 [Clostridia bacterium]|nr:hypothetical protein [Clostridia bacterium]